MTTKMIMMTVETETFGAGSRCSLFCGMGAHFVRLVASARLVVEEYLDVIRGPPPDECVAYHAELQDYLVNSFQHREKEMSFSQETKSKQKQTQTYSLVTLSDYIYNKQLTSQNKPPRRPKQTATYPNIPDLP